jgi:hypothetical protein
MMDYTVKVTKLTDVELLRAANDMTRGDGKQSTMLLRTCYRTMHSNARTQMFWIELHNIPSFVCGHLVRHVHAQPYVQSRRTDRGGADFNDECRNIAFRVGTCWINATNNKDFIPQAAAECQVMAEKIERLPETYDRLAPQSMALLLSAEEIINISKVRLCRHASFETRQVWEKVREEIRGIDSDLADFMVPQCTFRGGLCSEPKCCGYIFTVEGMNELNRYRAQFSFNFANLTYNPI